MLLGDLITAVTHELPVKLVVFDNGRLGMVKLEQEQGGLPEFGTVLHNPDLAAVARAIGLHGVRVSDPDDVDDAVRDAFARPGPVLLDVLTNPDEISLPAQADARPGLGLRDRQAVRVPWFPPFFSSPPPPPPLFRPCFVLCALPLAPPP